MRMKICPECGKPISYNYYFGAYICNDCDWEQPINYAPKEKKVATTPSAETSLVLLPVCTNCGKVIDNLEYNIEAYHTPSKNYLSTINFTPGCCPFCGQEISNISCENKFLNFFNSMRR